MPGKEFTIRVGAGGGMRGEREIVEKRKMSVKVRRKEGKAGGRQEAAVQMEGIR